jgi:nucleotide-binding universal stress UspA family protein
MLIEGEEAVAYIEDKSKNEGVSFERVILKGDPSDKLLRYSKERGTDILVIGSIGRTGISKFLLGSVAEKMVRHSEVPVMVLPFRTQ